MEKETELLASRKSGENGVVLLKPLKPLQPLTKGLFKLPQPDVEDDDDENDCISLKEWQPEEPKSPSIYVNGTSYSAWQPVKEKETSSNGFSPLKSSVRTHPIDYALVETNGNVCLPPSIHGGALPKLPPSEPERNGEGDQHEDDHDNGSFEDGLEDDLEDEPEPECSNDVMEPELTEHYTKISHHQHSISLVNGIAPPPSQSKGGIAFDITLDDRGDSLPRRSTGSSRGSSLRVSFINEVMLDSPSPPRHTNKSPLRPRHNQNKSSAKSKPSWESSTKVGKPAPIMPKKFVRPTLHGIKVKKGQGGVAKTAMRMSMSSIESENSFAKEGRPRGVVTQSWDPQQYCGGGEYDSMSQLISNSLVSSTEDKKEDSHGFSSTPGRPFLPRNNGARKHDGHDLQNGGEVLKSGSGVIETNKLTGDFGRLFSKLRRASAPLSKPPTKLQPSLTSKPSSVPVLSKMTRTNSAPVENSKATSKKTLAPLHSLDSSGANQKFAIGSYASLKLLQECAQTEKIPLNAAYNAPKPRKIRDHEPHRHYYKTISKTLDSKLK